MLRTIYQTATKGQTVHKRDIGEFSKLKGRGMRFAVRVYDVADTGSLCFMKMKAFFGLMKMETAVFSPTGIDGPLFSCDYIHAFGKQTLFLELYDTTLSHPKFSELKEVVDEYGSLPAYDPGIHWYDHLRLPESDFKKGKLNETEVKEYLAKYSQCYFDILKTCPTCDPDQKKSRNAEYADGLLTNGGPAVDQFVKMIGREKTAVFLKNIMFAAK